MASMQEGVQRVDLEGNIVFENPAASRMLGWDAAELLGKSSHSVMHHRKANGAPYPRSACPILATLQDGIHREIADEVFWRKDGTCFPVEYSVAPMRDARHEIVGAVVIFRDISERKRLEREVQTSARFSSIGFLAAGMAHEINNPLNFVVGNLDYVWEMLPTWKSECAEHEKALPILDTVTEALGDARNGAERIRNIVADLKLLSRSDDAQPLVEVDLRRVVDSAANIARTLIHYHTRLVIESAEVPPVLGHSSRLAQVFLNLFTNAANALPEGDIEANEIRVRLARRGADVIAEVRDTGSGMTPEMLAHIFDPFFSTKPVGQGTGLGLAVCRGIVTQLGGTIEAESVVGHGSVFRVVLPAVPTHAASADSASFAARPTNSDRTWD